MMDAQTEFRQRLEKKLRSALEEGGDQLARGYAQDYPQYMDRVGYLRGFRQVLDLCAEVEKEMSK